MFRLCYSQNGYGVHIKHHLLKEPSTTPHPLRHFIDDPIRRHENRIPSETFSFKKDLQNRRFKIFRGWYGLLNDREKTQRKEE